MMDLHLPISSVALKKLPNLNFSLRLKIVKQTVPGFKSVVNIKDLHYEVSLSGFYDLCAKFSRIGKYLFEFVD